MPSADMTDAQADEIRRKLAERHVGISYEEEIKADLVGAAKAV